MDSIEKGRSSRGSTGLKRGATSDPRCCAQSSRYRELQWQFCDLGSWSSARGTSSPTPSPTVQHAKLLWARNKLRVLKTEARSRKCNDDSALVWRTGNVWRYCLVTGTSDRRREGREIPSSPLMDHRGHKIVSERNHPRILTPELIQALVTEQSHAVARTQAMIILTFSDQIPHSERAAVC
ncbi:hypothetical protein CC2G_004211 [Coprinopsis cinerea AmutBmut pab1-1]|nr:hypothetical protein CC2G_004211 [Coprinopsis cinerea AmutBmut pab1-1]